MRGYFDELNYSGSQSYKRDVLQRAGHILQPEEFVKEQDQIAELEGGGGENSSVNEKAADNLYEKSSSDHELDRDSRGASALGRL